MPPPAPAFRLADGQGASFVQGSKPSPHSKQEELMLETSRPAEA